jgi:hypothetical protein
MLLSKWFLTIIFLTFIISTMKPEEIVLTKQEKETCKSISFDTLLADILKKETGNIISIIPQIDAIGDSIGLSDVGICSIINKNGELNILKREMSYFLKMKHLFKQKGYLFFIFADNDGNEYLASIKGTDELSILEWRQTNGINYNIKNIDIINKLTHWKNQNDILIFSVGRDFIQFFFVSSLVAKVEAQNLSKEILEFCPDVLGHDKNNLKVLSKEIKETNGIYLWWD